MKSHTLDQHMSYLGTLGLLAECAVYVPEDIRESIERAMEDAADAGLIRWRRILNRIEVEAEMAIENSARSLLIELRAKHKGVYGVGIGTDDAGSYLVVLSAKPLPKDAIPKHYGGWRVEEKAIGQVRPLMLSDEDVDG